MRFASFFDFWENGKKKKNKKAGISAAVVQKFRLFDDFTELLFVSPADDLPVGVAAVDDAYDEHAGDGHIPNDFIYMNGNVNFILILHFYKPSLLLIRFLIPLF